MPNITAASSAPQMVTPVGLRNALRGNFIIAWLMTAVTDALPLCFSRVGALNVLNKFGEGRTLLREKWR